MNDTKNKAKLIALMVEYKDLVTTVDKADGTKGLIEVYKEAIKILRKVDRLMEKLEND